MTMVYQVVWSEKSKTDLTEIIEYLVENWGVRSARKFRDTVFKTVEIISMMPTLYPLTEYRVNLRRCIVVSQVSMYYLVNEAQNEISIVRFYDNRRNPDKLSEILEEEE